VVGVMPPQFQFMGSEVDLWSPMQLNEARDWRIDAGRFVHAFAQLKPGVSPAAAQRDLRVIAKQLESEHPQFNTGWSVALSPSVTRLRASFARHCGCCWGPSDYYWQLRAPM
jgi:hypothetical protein